MNQLENTGTEGWGSNLLSLYVPHNYILRNMSFLKRHALCPTASQIGRKRKTLSSLSKNESIKISFIFIFYYNLVLRFCLFSNFVQSIVQTNIVFIFKETKETETYKKCKYKFIEAGFEPIIITPNTLQVHNNEVRF